MATQPGLSLADIASITENVPVGDSFIRVNGISASACLSIFKRYPELAKLLTGFKMADLLGSMPDAVSAILAAGTGHSGDEEAELAARDIPLEIQFDLIEAIGGLTFKNGFAPFVQRLLALANAADFASYTKVAAMKLPQESKPASPLDTTQTTSGDTLQDK